MAGQVNTRFVIILSTVLVVLVGGVVLLSNVISRDTDDLVASAEQYMAEGDYDRAIETLKRAVTHSQSDPEIIQKYVEFSKLVPAADQVEAANTMQIVQQNTLALTQIDVNSEIYLRDYAELIKHTINKVQTTGGLHPFLRYIYQASTARLDAVPGDELARRYRGIYGLILLNAEMTEEDINVVRDDLIWAQATFPDDVEVINSVARWNLFEAARLDRPGGDEDQAKVLRDQAIVLSQGLVDADPQNITRMVEHLQVLYQATRKEQDREDPFVSIKPLLDEIEQRLLADPKPFNDVSMAENFIKSVFGRALAAEEDGDGEAQPLQQNEGIRRSLALLTRAAEANPDDARYKLLLGIALKQAGEFEQARTYLQAVKDLSTQGPYLDVLLNSTIKGSAEVEYTDLLISLSEMADSDEARDAIYAEAEQLLEKFSGTGRGETARVLLLKGRLALAQGKMREGLVSIDKATEMYDAYSREKAEAMLLSARARAQQGDWGAATERYEQLLQANPNIPSVRLQLASIYLRQHQFDEAQDHLDAVFVNDPQNEQAKVVQAGIYAAQGDLDLAIKTYSELDLPNRPDLALGLSQLMVQGGRKQQAVAMLNHYFDADPSNIRLLSALLRAEENLERKYELIVLSREAGGDPDTLNVLEQQLNPEVAGDIQKTVEMLLEKQEDPFVRAITETRLYARAGDSARSREALARAAELQPDHKAVIDAQFSYALQDGDLTLAQRLADQAAQGNLDEADGRFYLAQVHKARGDLAAAIETLIAALDVIPINSDGWRMLGDLYVSDSNDQDAVAAYEKALKQKPDNLLAMRGLAAIRDRQGRHEEVLAMIRKSRNQFPNNKPLNDLYLSYESRHGDKQLVLRLRRELKTQHPANANNVRALAMLLAETGQAEQGTELMRGLIAEEGDTVLNVQTMAAIHRHAGQPERGEQAIRRYIQSRGSEAGAEDHLLLARYLVRVKDGNGAFSAYQEAIGVESDKREASRELAGLLFSRGAYDRAMPIYRDLFDKAPDDNVTGLRLADALIRTGQHDEAAKVLDQIDGGSTEDALAALIAEQRGDHEEAIRLINRAIEADAGKAVFYYERAALNAQDLAMTDDAVRDLNTALSHDPGHLLSRRLLVAMYQRRGERNEAIRELINMVARHPDYNDGRLTLIRLYAQDGNISRARTLARQGLEQSDTVATWHMVLGDLALREGDTAGAIASYTRVFDLVPSAGQLMKITTIQLENGRGADAQAILRKHADMVNTQPILQAVMGRSLYATGKTDEARQVFARAVERCTVMDQLYGVAMQVREDYTLEETTALLQGLTQPPSAKWLEITLARLELADNLAEQAISRARALESSLPGGDSAERQAVDQVLAAGLHQTGQSEQARVYYERLVEIMPDDASLLNNLAYLLAEDMNQPGEALPLAERAAELSPKNAQVLDTLGWIQFKLGQTDAARRTLESSIEAEGLTANHLHLAELLIGQGYRAEATRHLQTVIDLAEQTNETKMLERAQELMKQADDLTEAS